MTKDEAKAFQNWAGMDGITAWHLIDRHADNWSEIGLMMTAWLEANQKPNSIAQAIRDAAVNWNSNSYDKLHESVEWELVKSFCNNAYLVHQLLGWNGAADKNQARTFMLFVAEALES